MVEFFSSRFWSRGHAGMVWPDEGSWGYSTWLDKKLFNNSKRNKIDLSEIQRNKLLCFLPCPGLEKVYALCSLCSMQHKRQLLFFFRFLYEKDLRVVQWWGLGFLFANYVSNEWGWLFKNEKRTKVFLLFTPAFTAPSLISKDTKWMEIGLIESSLDRRIYICRYDILAMVELWKRLT